MLHFARRFQCEDRRFERIAGVRTGGADLDLLAFADRQTHDRRRAARISHLAVRTHFDDSVEYLDRVRE